MIDDGTVYGSVAEIVAICAATSSALGELPGAGELAQAGRLRLWPLRPGTDGFCAALWPRR